jgi:hypothetical protein
MYTLLEVPLSQYGVVLYELHDPCPGDLIEQNCFYYRQGGEQFHALEDSMYGSYVAVPATYDLGSAV